MTESARIGVTGLAVMGRNLARNLARHGYAVAVHNRTPARTKALVEEFGHEGTFVPAESAEEFVASLERPRRVVIMVKAGGPTDEVINEFAPLLEPGDMIIDAGNAHFVDTRRREAALKERGLHFVGTGVSGGEEGALLGPSIMPGGSPESYAALGPILEDISAKVNGTPCCTHVGPDGAGHYVKMVHNGIEYADMQLIAEALAHTDESGRPFVDVVLDQAEQKGTGRWTVQIALDLGVPVSGIAEAVFARSLSGSAELRAAARGLPGPRGGSLDAAVRDTLVDDVEKALYASKMVAYAQGFNQIQAGSAEYGWNIDPGAMATIWRGGCIIRARFLDRIKTAYDADRNLPSLLVDDHFTDALRDGQDAWRRVVAAAAQLGIPVPGFATALAYYDGLRAERLPAALIQGLRDFFGAHTYRRVDRDGTFHTLWAEEGRREVGA